MGKGTSKGKAGQIVDSHNAAYNKQHQDPTAHIKSSSTTKGKAHPTGAVVSDPGKMNNSGLDTTKYQ